ncbi:MAG: hypothetical protein KDD37_04915, partial [Bdellovibrionales bacterium]|nr:hypothetical protein [Bdellovibrionales bacterium]
MKVLLSLLIISAGSFAQALDVYNCDISAIAKSGSASVWTKKIFLSKDFSNQVDFSEDRDTRTILDLTVSNGSLRGYVNGQPNHIIEGTPV